MPIDSLYHCRRALRCSGSANLSKKGLIRQTRSLDIELINGFAGNLCESVDRVAAIKQTKHHQNIRALIARKAQFIAERKDTGPIVSWAMRTVDRYIEVENTRISALA